jgi:23S rRNA (guanosine2251-2'-O)-methyltransferase
MSQMIKIALIAHNLRSCHNVGSLLRTAEGLGIEQILLTGYTPYPLEVNDSRMLHIAKKLDSQIHKTALGAEKFANWKHEDSILDVISKLKAAGFVIAALEQAPESIKLPDYKPPKKLALILGREVEGIEPEVLKLCDITLEIPMSGKKESFNVVQAAAMALYHLSFN